MMRKYGEELVILCIIERSEDETDSFWQLSLKLPLKCQCFSKISFYIISAAPLRCIALFCSECFRKYSKAAAKSSLKEMKTSFLRDVVTKFELIFNIFFQSCHINLYYNNWYRVSQSFQDNGNKILV